MTYAIKAKKDNSELYPVGSISDFLGAVISDGWLEAAGQFVPVDEYQELYEVIGDGYCPKMETALIAIPWWKLPFTLTRPMEKVPNPKYRPGMFRIPDIRGH